MHVVLVTGWGKQEVLWKPYRAWFRRAGISTSLLDIRYSGFGPIQSSAKQLARHVNDLKHPPILLGHSTGGLIIRQYMAAYHAQSQTEVAGVVTIASPLYGTPVARIAPWSASACQMVPGSNFLAKLESLPDPEVPWFSIRCSYDFLVPGDSPLLEAEGTIHMTATATHLSGLFSKKLFSDVRDFCVDSFNGDLTAFLEEEGVEEIAEEDE